MNTFVLVITLFVALKIVASILTFSQGDFPVTRNTSSRMEAIILVLRLSVFLWGFVLLLRSTS
jgi:hypothetical protein